MESDITLVSAVSSDSSSLSKIGSDSSEVVDDPSKTPLISSAQLNMGVLQASSLTLIISELRASALSALLVSSSETLGLVSMDGRC